MSKTNKQTTVKQFLECFRQLSYSSELEAQIIEYITEAYKEDYNVFLDNTDGCGLKESYEKIFLMVATADELIACKVLLCCRLFIELGIYAMPAGDSFYKYGNAIEQFAQSVNKVGRHKFLRESPETITKNYLNKK